MAAYHVILTNFPMALWMTATLAILWRAVSDGPLARAIDRALVPLLTLGLISGVVAFAVGTRVWAWEAISSTPLGRNHVLLASWTVAYWAVLLALRWLKGEAIWEGVNRWIMAALALLGAVLLGITGTLGGHLIGVYTDVATALRLLGWEVYTTFYVPTTTLWLIAAAIVVLVGLGLWGYRQARTEPRSAG